MASADASESSAALAATVPICWRATKGITHEGNSPRTKLVLIKSKNLKTHFDLVLGHGLSNQAESDNTNSR